MNMASESVPHSAGKFILNSKSRGAKELETPNQVTNDEGKLIINFIIFTRPIQLLPSTASGEDIGVRTIHGPHLTAWYVTKKNR